MASKTWASFIQNVTRFDATKLSPWLAVRNTLGIGLPIAGGIALHMVSGGLAVATGALNVAFSDSQEPYPTRARRMLAASGLVGFAVFLGALCGHNSLLATAIVVAWAFAAGLLVALSQTAADLGGVSLVTLIVYLAVPQTIDRAIYAGLLAFGGGVLQTLLAVAFWPLHRRSAERRVLSDLFVELARVAAEPVRATQSPPATTQISAAHATFASIASDHSVEAERYRLLLSQAERLRLSLLLLGRLRIRVEREDPESPAIALLNRYFEICARHLKSIGEALRTEEGFETETEELDALSDALRAFDLPILVEARFHMDAIGGQLRAAMDLAGSTTSGGMAEYEEREARRPWYLRLAGAFATLRANLNLESAACRHAIRLAVCVGFGEGLGRALGLRRAYWAPMTIAIVLKPDFTSTFSRGVLRLIGTFGGLVLSTGLFHLVRPELATDAVMVIVMMFAMRWIGPANYGVFSGAVTGLVVALLSMTGVDPRGVMIARGINTGLGGTVALAAYWLWPTWERRQLSETMARMLEAYRQYFRTIRESYEHPDAKSEAARDRVRVAARLARSDR